MEAQADAIGFDKLHALLVGAITCSTSAPAASAARGSDTCSATELPATVIANDARPALSSAIHSVTSRRSAPRASAGAATPLVRTAWRER